MRYPLLLLDVCVDGICLYGATYFEPYRQQALAALRQSKLRRQRVGGTLMWLFPQMPVTDWELSWEGYLEYELSRKVNDGFTINALRTTHHET